jgi:DNA-binding NarL/FixJ family response regulator
MMRTGLAQLIGNEPDLTVAAEADTAGQAIGLVSKQKFDLALLDISLPDKNGLELPILVVSMHDEMIYAERVLRAGGRGYIMKQEGGQKFLTAIRQVLSRQIYVSDSMSSRTMEIFSGRTPGQSGPPVQKLSDREFEVFQLVGQGVGTRAIAEHLRLSVRRWRSTAPTSRRSSASSPRRNCCAMPCAGWTRRGKVHRSDSFGHLVIFNLNLNHQRCPKRIMIMIKFGLHPV